MNSHNKNNPLYENLKRHISDILRKSQTPRQNFLCFVCVVTCTDFDTWIHAGSGSQNVQNAGSTCTSVNYSDRCALTCDQGYLMRNQNASYYTCRVGGWTADTIPAVCDLGTHLVRNVFETT